MTKQERKDIYWAAMFEVVAFELKQTDRPDMNLNIGLCFLLYYTAGKDPSKTYSVPNDFPEVWKCRPKGAYQFSHWWPRESHIDERLDCLSRAIDLCE